MGREMKDSGSPWLGQVPEMWNITRMKSCILQRDNGAWGNEPQNNERDVICLRIADFDYKKYRFKEMNTDKVTVRNYSDEVIKKLILKNGDIIIEKSGGGEKTPVGRTVIFDKPYKALYANFCDRIRCRDIVQPDYMQYILVTFYQNRYVWNYIKQTTGIQNLDLTTMFSIEKIAIPTLEEQNNIVSFLNRKCTYLDRMIEHTNINIKEYKKFKMALITHIVTQGIGEDCPVKDSGIEWIGKIPENWKVTQLRHCASIRSGIALGKKYSKDTELVEMPYLRVANVQDGYVDTNDVAVLQVSKEEIEKYNLSAGEVLMTEGGDRDKLGRGCVWDGRITPCLHQNHIFSVKVKENLLNPYYLEYLTASSVGRTYFDVTAVKTTNLACTSSSKVLAFTIPLPSIEEQNEIVDYLKEKCGCIETAISKKEQFISELENYKKSLIYEYVTGKKEVPKS